MDQNTSSVTNLEHVQSFTLNELSFFSVKNHPVNNKIHKMLGFKIDFQFVQDKTLSTLKGNWNLTCFFQWKETNS